MRSCAITEKDLRIRLSSTDLVYIATIARTFKLQGLQGEEFWAAVKALIERYKQTEAEPS